MLHSLGHILRFAGTPFRFVARRPRLAVLVGLLVIAAAAVGGWRYAVSQWDEAQKAVREARFEDARSPLAFCLAVWPSSPEVHLLAARSARRTGDLKAGEIHLNRCIELQGGATQEVQIEFLLLRVQGGEADELASPLFAIVDQGHPESVEILETIARAYTARLRYKPAYACVSKWIEIEPDNPRPYHWRGWLLERLNNQKGATVDYHRALELDPDLVPVRLRVAEMLLEDKQAPEARPHLERLMTQAPDDPSVQARMGICLFLQGEMGEARRLMEGAAEHLKADPALLVTLANLDLQDGNAKKAEERLRAVLKEDPSDTEALFVLGSALQLQGRSAEATATLAEYETKRATVDRINDLLKDKADSPTATAGDYTEIGSLFFQIDREKFGVYWLEQALEIDPGYEPAHRTLADYYERTDNPAAAAVHRRQAGAGPPPPAAPSPSRKRP